MEHVELYSQFDFRFDSKCNVGLNVQLKCKWPISTALAITTLPML